MSVGSESASVCCSRARTQSWITPLQQLQSHDVTISQGGEFCDNYHFNARDPRLQTSVGSVCNIEKENIQGLEKKEEVET